MKHKNPFIIVPIITVCLIVCIFITHIFIVPQIRYKKGLKLLNTAKYSSSAKVFSKLHDYKDSDKLLKRAKRLQADVLIKENSYEAAYNILEEIGDYESVNANIYERASKLLESNNYNESLKLYNRIKNYKDSANKLDEIMFVSEKDDLRSAQIGDTVKLGKYEQDNSIENGSESIEWIVLDNKDGKLFLLSKYCIGVDYFDDTYIEEGRNIACLEASASYKSVAYASSWKACSLGKYLNNGFVEEAFNNLEQKLIISSLYQTMNDSDKDGEIYETYNKVVLLSRSEARHYFKTINEFKCKPTAVAIDEGISETDGFSPWWLRDTGGGSTNASFVDAEGILDSFGDPVNEKFGIRPAMWVTIPQ